MGNRTDGRRTPQPCEAERKTAELLATNLRLWRMRQGLLQKQLAPELHVGISALSAWEKGDRFPLPTNLDLLAKRLGVPVKCLFCKDFENCSCLPQDPD
ncbi:MAG: helix-turn-helix transcriptional regulator [Lentisphaerae bacterium]|nr:helix-turn-helix transcriptional regulator [Lentisphaerota bacterium]